MLLINMSFILILLKSLQIFRTQECYNTWFPKFVHGIWYHLDIESENYNLTILVFLSWQRMCKHMHIHTIRNGTSEPMNLFW